MTEDIQNNKDNTQFVLFVDRIMGMGFTYATKGGISFGKDDLVIPPEKEKLISQTKTMVSEFEQQYADGLITQGDRARA